MSKIRIKNFGPIKTGFLENDGWMEIEKVTVFLGNQGSGKSTVAKLISTFSWMEKALTRGDFEDKWFMNNDRFRNTLCAYHRLEDYFFDKNGKDNAELDYQGDSYSISYRNSKLSIKESKKANYALPKIMYVPAERNFISTIQSPQLLKLSSDSLVEFLTEFDNAKRKMNGGLQLPINETKIKYDEHKDQINIEGENYLTQLTHASSGFQSVVPLFMVSWYLVNILKGNIKSTESMSSDELKRFRESVGEIWADKNFTEEQKRAAISVLSQRFNKTAFINIVEEPEQNLFPSSQRQILNSLLIFNNLSEGNKLILTTHSPYIVNYLSIAIQAADLKSKIDKLEKTKEYFERLRTIQPEGSTISGSKVIIYEMDETNGSIRKLPTYEGIPSDKNYLNTSLQEANQLFDGLLEIEQGL